MQMQQCVECGSAELSGIDEETSFEMDGYTFLAPIPAQACQRCKQVYLDGPALGRFELLVASKLAGLGTRSGSAFKFMRKAAGFRAADLADLLGVDVATISRWETEKVAIDRAALATLGSLLRDKLAGTTATLEHLHSLEKPPTARTKAIRLVLNQAA